MWRAMFYGLVVARIFSKFAYLVLILAMTPCLAAALEQALDPLRSKTSFVLSGPLLSLRGEFKRYNARIKLRAGDLALEEVSFDVDFTAIAVDARPEAALVLNKLAAQLPVSGGRFESRRIVKRPRGEYHVVGDFFRAGSRWPFEFVLRPVRVVRQESVFEVLERGKVSEMDPQVRPVLLPPDGSAELQARLVFKALRK